MTFHAEASVFVVIVMLIMTLVVINTEFSRIRKHISYRADKLEEKLALVMSKLEIPMPDEINSEVKALLQSGQKIAAIKLYRDKTGASLRDAKEAVELMA